MSATFANSAVQPLGPRFVASVAAPIRVFVVDDHPVARDGLAAMLGDSPGIEWVGDAASAAEALRTTHAAAPDVVLMDDILTDMDGAHAVHQLRRHWPSARYVMLMREPDSSLERRAHEAGVFDVLSKTANATELENAIRSAYQGHNQAAGSRAAASPASGRQPGADLTARERDLLGLLARGLSNQEISTRLGIAVPTVKFHVSNVMSKLGVENRTTAVLVALRNGLVD
jgi:two-component system, NarL family, response regulator LiaR